MTIESRERKCRRLTCDVGNFSNYYNSNLKLNYIRKYPGPGDDVTSKAELCSICEKLFKSKCVAACNTKL